jgi:hypothetical protein
VGHGEGYEVVENLLLEKGTEQDSTGYEAVMKLLSVFSIIQFNSSEGLD